MRIAVAGLVAGAAALLSPATADAVPDCSEMAMNTRICSTPGHTAISSSPNPAFTNPYPGWGFGTPGTPGFLGIPAIGLGGGGLWVGF